MLHIFEEKIIILRNRKQKVGLFVNAKVTSTTSFVFFIILRKLQNNYLMYLSEDSLSGACNNLRNL